jgi:hypothetical protein
MAASTSSVTPACRPLVVALVGPVAVGCCAVGAAAYVAGRDPASGGAYPLCALRSVTGWWCPGCGITRAAHHLLHGDVGQALGNNALIVPVVALLALGWITWLLDCGGRRPAWVQRTTVPAWIGLGIIAAAFAIARNVPSLGALRG